MIKNGKIRLNVSLYVPEISEVGIRTDLVGWHWDMTSTHTSTRYMDAEAERHQF